MAWKSRSEEWSRPPEPSPDASGMLVQLLRAATECEFDLVPEPGQVMQKGLDLGSRTATKGGTHDAVIMNLTPKCPCEGLIERAYTLGAQLGLAVWREDEAGPFQAVPHPGVSWQPHGQPAIQPHEYIRGGTTKILTLFHPATGRVRLQPATHCTNAVLHPWLRKQLSAILAALPGPKPS